jgi:thymidylate synthase (FAD)
MEVMKMAVTLLKYTPDPERTVAVAARVCYSPATVGELETALSDAEIGRLLGYLLRAGHTSTFEHASFTFGIEGSRAALNQLVRHRIASYSQQSQRYVKLETAEYVTPPAIACDAPAAERFAAAMRECWQAYADLLALGMSKEDARYILPVGSLSRLVATLNARSLHNLFALRCCERAQWEIRDIAREMLRLVREVAPRLFAKAGPSCETHGVCMEGELSCGRLSSLRRAGKPEEVRD